MSTAHSAGAAAGLLWVPLRLTGPLRVARVDLLQFLGDGGDGVADLPFGVFRGGLAQCGACSVLLDGKEIRSCVTPVAAVSGKSITTLEGPPALYAASRGTTAAAPALHPLQQAWIDVQVPHCGYCQNGMMIQAADLLATTKNPSEDQIRTAMNGHLCRCGTYPRILTAIQKAAAVMAKGGA